jgi:L-2,4-diaminobutyric acid acetyltransferase
MIRPMTQTDFASVYQLVQNSGALDVHTPYTYWVMLNVCGGLGLVYERDHTVAGFVAGLAPFRMPDEALVWQIAVQPQWQRQGIGMRLLDDFASTARSRGFRSLCVTISPSNVASRQLFLRFAEHIGSCVEEAGSTGTMEGLMREENIYQIPIA